LTEADLGAPGLIFQIGVAPLRIDIMTSIDGVSFAEAWPARLLTRFADQPAAVLSREHLIKNKAPPAARRTLPTSNGWKMARNRDGSTLTRIMLAVVGCAQLTYVIAHEAGRPTDGDGTGFRSGKSQAVCAELRNCLIARDYFA